MTSLREGHLNESLYPYLLEQLEFNLLFGVVSDLMRNRFIIRIVTLIYSITVIYLWKINVVKDLMPTQTKDDSSKSR